MAIRERASVILACASVFLGGQTVSAQLLIDFNSTTQDGGPHNEPGYQAYDAGHEVAPDFVTKTYIVVFPNGPATVQVTPIWPNTTDNRVQQMPDRGPANDANWVGNSIDLLTDWIGSDSRPINGGNGDWDRTGGTTPTYLTLVLGGLPAGGYDWLSFHHDTEYVWSDFQVEISTDSGATFGSPFDMQMTSSSVGGSPPSYVSYTGASDPDPRNLPSTFTTAFAADGVNDVVLRFAPFVDGADPVGVHKQLFGMNGFELTFVAPGEQIFINGFESGDTCAWDLTEPMCGFCPDEHSVALWRFDETSGQILIDSSGNSRHLTLGPTSAVEPNDPVRSQGRFDQGLFFESIDSDYASGSQSNTFPTNELTVELWVRPTGGSGSSGHAQVFTAGLINCAMATRTGFNNVWFAIGNGSSWESMYGDVVGVDLDDGAWHYIAMTYDGATLTGYIDGQVAASQAASIILANPTDYKVGGRPANTFLDGWMDDVRLSDVARSATDIAGTWNSALQCP